MEKDVLKEIDRLMDALAVDFSRSIHDEYRAFLVSEYRILNTLRQNLGCPSAKSIGERCI